MQKGNESHTHSVLTIYRFLVVIKTYIGDWMPFSGKPFMWQLNDMFDFYNYVWSSIVADDGDRAKNELNDVRTE